MIKFISRSVRAAFRTFMPASLQAYLLWADDRSLGDTEVNEDTALNFSAVWAAVNRISDTYATTPKRLYRWKGDEREMIEDDISLLVTSKPNPFMIAHDLWKLMIINRLNWGTGYCEIERDGTSKPIALWPIHPARVTPIYKEKVTLGYKVTIPDDKSTTNQEQEAKYVLADNMLVFHHFSTDGIHGKGVLDVANDAIKLGLQTEKYGVRIFKKGAIPSGVITRPATATKLSDDASKKFLDDFIQYHSMLEGRSRIALLQEGMDYKTLGLPPEQVQLLQIRKFQVEEIARFYNIPPHMLALLISATFGNIEQLSAEFITYCMHPIYSSTMQELNSKLLTTTFRRNRYEFGIIDDLYLRGDSSSRWKNHEIGVRNGIITVDEARAMEGLNPLPNGQGKVLSHPMNTVTSNMNGDILYEKDSTHTDKRTTEDGET